MVDPPIDGKASLKDQLRQKHVMFQLRAQRVPILDLIFLCLIF